MGSFSHVNRNPDAEALAWATRWLFVNFLFPDTDSFPSLIKSAISSSAASYVLRRASVPDQFFRKRMTNTNANATAVSL